MIVLSHALDPAADLPVGLLMGRIAAELRRLEDLSGALQGALSGVLGAAGADARGVADLQAIDTLSQTLAALAGVAEAAAAQVPPGWALASASLLADVTLGELAGRLGQGGPAPAREPSGAVELF